ncbi:hypothetical protein ZWY2020_027828, partial [Hordeum vulgare]
AEFDYRKLGIIIPGFASTQLRAWSVLDCPYSPVRLQPLFSAVNCWLKCMLLDPYNQTDHPECKSRPDSGPLSSIWKEWVKWCVDFGIEANAIIAVPYDWRLPPSMLEERDLYFHKLKAIFGFCSFHGKQCIRHFLEWLKLEIAPKHYIQWLEKHIHAYFVVGMCPLLGSTESVRATLSGTTPDFQSLRLGTARLMFNSFVASLWLLPFSKYCKADNVYWKQQCDEMEYSSDNSGWPTTLASIEVPTVRGTDAYPSIMDITEDIISNMECGKPTLLSFSAREVSDGTLFKTMLDYDPQSKALIHQLEKYYQGDPVLNPLTPWERPPINNVFCIYGIDTKNELYGKPYPDNWIITDVIYEFEQSLLSRSGHSFSGKPNNSSGDGTVSYNSLSWCKQWLGPKVNITRTPQYITYYEDAESIPGWRIAVWELDKVVAQMWHDMHPYSKSKLHEDCHWDYAKARCGFPEFCEYRYMFGDVHLGMSCRLKYSSTMLLRHSLARRLSPPRNQLVIPSTNSLPVRDLVSRMPKRRWQGDEVQPNYHDRGANKPKSIYLVLDDWHGGFTIRKLDADSPDLSEPPVFRLASPLNNHAMDFAALGRNIIATSNQCAATLVFDTEAEALAIGNPLPDALLSSLNFFVTADDMLFAFAYYFTSRPPSFEVMTTAKEDEVRSLCPSTDWSWKSIPAPFTKHQRIVSYALHRDRRTIFVSVHDRNGSGTGTFSFDSENCEWRRHGEWMLLSTAKVT